MSAAASVESLPPLTARLRPPTTPGTPLGDGFRNDVQGLRGVAVLLVVLYHAREVVPGGYVGVDVFFVVSGFVITRSLRREYLDRGTVGVGSFVSRRVRRLMPALAATLVGTCALSLLVASPTGQIQATAETARAAAVSLANFQLYGAADYFDPAAETNPLLHTWSLSVEEQFYAAYAVLLAVTAGALVGVRARWWARAAMVAVVVLSIAASIRWTRGDELLGVDDPVRWAYFAPFGRVGEFLVGVLVATHQGASTRRPVVRDLGAAVGCAAIVGSAMLLQADSAFPGWVVLVPVIGTAMVLGARSGRVARVLSVRPLTWVGDISYGWYLWHWPLIVLAVTIDLDLVWPAVALSLVIAAVSYRWMEEPIRRRADWTGWRAAVLAAACIGTAVGSAFVTTRLADTGLGLDVDAFVTRTEARDRGCHTDVDEPIPPIQSCTWPVPGATGLVMLVGDSHAISIADTVVAEGNALGYDVAVQTRSICPFQTRRVLRRGCAAYQRDTIALVESLRPDVLVIANRAPAYTHPEVVPGFPVVDADDELPATTRDAVSAWDEGWRELIERIDEPAGRIVILETVPEFDDDAYSFSPPSVLRPRGRSATISLDEVADRRSATSSVHRGIAAGYDDVEIVDPVPILCGDVCSQRRPDGWVFYDDDHVSLYGASLLGPALAEAFSAAGD